MCDDHMQLSVFLCCRIQLPQQSCFLLHKTSVEYTRLYFSIVEVLIYTVEPRIPCNDVFSKCWIFESNPVGARVLLKLYISPSPFSSFIVCYKQIIHSSHSPESPHPLSSHQTQADAPSPTLDLPSPSHSIPSISE